MERVDVFFYNRWREVDLPSVRECFERLSPQEILTLKPGDEVWYNDEPYHLNGKVYGYTRGIIKETPPKNDIASTVLFKLTHPRNLKTLIEEHGDKITSPISSDERKAFDRFQEVWRVAGLPV